MSKRVAEEPTKEEPAKEEESSDDEFACSNEPDKLEDEMLKKQLEKYVEPGRLVVIVGPTVVKAMWNMSLALQGNPTSEGVAFASNVLDCASSIKGKSLKQQVEMVLARARGADKWNRGIEMGSVLNAVFSAFNGLICVVHSDNKMAKGKSFPLATSGGGWVNHTSVVSGFISTAWSIKGGTKDLLLDAWRLQELVPELHAKEPTLYIGTSCWKVTVIDARSWKPPEDAPAGEQPAAKKQRKEELADFPVTEEKCNFPIRAAAEQE